MKKTMIVLAAVASLGMAAPAFAGEGSPDITDSWNNDRGTPQRWSAPAYGTGAYDGPAYQTPGVVYSDPALDDDDVDTGYAAPSMMDDDDDIEE